MQKFRRSVHTNFISLPYNGNYKQGQAALPLFCGEDTIDAVRKLGEDVGIPADLKEIVKEEDVQFLSESAYANACRPGNPPRYQRGRDRCTVPQHDVRSRRPAAERLWFQMTAPFSVR